MNTGILFALIIIAVLIALGLKKSVPEISALISLGICILLITICISRMRTILKAMDRLSQYIKIDSQYLVLLLKLIGIAYLCEFAAGISKEAGYSAIASQIEMVGKLTMLVVSLPVLLQVLETVLSLLT